MTYRSSRFSKLKQALTQDPATDPGKPQTWSPVPLDGDPRRPVRRFSDPRQLPGMNRLTASDGLTVIMPAVGTSADSAPTQVLPVVQDPPPSARHVDPTRWHDRTHVEDNDLQPETPGRHALNELIAAPDPMKELAGAPSRIIKALGGEPEVKDPSLRRAVQLFRAARDMGRDREARLSQDDARLEAVDARIKAFATRWAYDDAHWDRVAQALKAKQEASDAGQLTSAYASGGTEVALYKVDELSHEIARRALASSAVAQ